MKRLRRLTKGVRFEVITDLDGSFAVLYGENKLSGQWQRVGTCHITVLDYICDHGAKQALQEGLIKLDVVDAQVPLPQPAETGERKA